MIAIGLAAAAALFLAAWWRHTRPAPAPRRPFAPPQSNVRKVPR